MKKIKFTFELQNGGYFDVRNGYSFPVLGVVFNDHNLWRYEQRYQGYGFDGYQLRQIADKLDELNALTFEELNVLLGREHLNN